MVSLYLQQKKEEFAAFKIVRGASQLYCVNETVQPDLAVSMILLKNSSIFCPNNLDLQQFAVLMASVTYVVWLSSVSDNIKFYSEELTTKSRHFLEK